MKYTFLATALLITIESNALATNSPLSVESAAHSSVHFASAADTSKEDFLGHYQLSRAEWKPSSYDLTGRQRRATAADAQKYCGTNAQQYTVTANDCNGLTISQTFSPVVGRDGTTISEWSVKACAVDMAWPRWVQQHVALGAISGNALVVSTFAPGLFEKQMLRTEGVYYLTGDKALVTDNGQINCIYSAIPEETVDL